MREKAPPPRVPQRGECGWFFDVFSDALGSLDALSARKTFENRFPVKDKISLSDHGFGTTKGGEGSEQACRAYDAHTILHRQNSVQKSYAHRMRIRFCGGEMGVRTYLRTGRASDAHPARQRPKVGAHQMHIAPGKCECATSGAPGLAAIRSGRALAGPLRI
jgi:hypothetical protein